MSVKKSVVIASYDLLEDVDGDVLLRRSDGEPIRRTERDLVISAASAAARLSYRTDLLAQLPTLVELAAWYFPASNREVAGRRQGVYFISDPAHPAQVKIGYTSGSLSSRLTALRREQGCTNPLLLAVALTPQYRELEESLHAYFDAVRVEREWFASGPVAEWLTELRASRYGNT